MAVENFYGRLKEQPENCRPGAEEKSIILISSPAK